MSDKWGSTHKCLTRVRAQVTYLPTCLPACSREQQHGQQHDTHAYFLHALLLLLLLATHTSLCVNGWMLIRMCV